MGRGCVLLGGGKKKIGVGGGGGVWKKSFKVMDASFFLFYHFIFYTASLPMSNAPKTQTRNYKLIRFSSVPSRASQRSHLHRMMRGFSVKGQSRPAPHADSHYHMQDRIASPFNLNKPSQPNLVPSSSSSTTIAPTTIPVPPTPV